MGTTVSLSQPALAVDPGSSVTTSLRVRNTGDVVDQITFQPLGDVARWITVEPAELRLFPNTDETVEVKISPPRDAQSAPGVTDWAVRALPKEDPEGSAVAEGTVDVGMFAEVGAEMQPEIGHGRLRGRFELAIDNRGNIPVPVRTVGTDAEQALDFDIDPPLMDCEPGTARFAKIKVKPTKRIWKGAPKTYAFEILAEPQIIAVEPPVPPTPPDLPAPGSGGTALLEAPAPPAAPALPTVAPMTLTGTYVQVPILPPWFWKAVLLALALLLVLFILWQTLFKPTIESAAREVAVEETEELEEEVAAIEEKVDDAAVAEEVQAAATAEDIAAIEEDVAGGGDAGGGALGNTFNESTEPSNFRLAVSAAPGAAATTPAAALPANTTFALTDVILQNPRGDLGIISVQLGGVPIIESSLDNFRDLDFHFVAPYISDSSTPISVVVECAAVQIPADGGCSPAVSFSGFETVVTPAES